jgi:hypothetical protein
MYNYYPKRRVFVEKLLVAQELHKLLAFYGIKNYSILLELE